jgi:hypothetical protein
MREEEKEMYKCQSYYDDDNILQDCTCGKCGEESWEKEYNRKYAPLMAKIDEYYWQKGYSKLENDLRKFISQALSSQLKEVEERIFQDVNIPAEVCKYIREKILAEVERLV